jgi:hypothetical protein
LADPRGSAICTIKTPADILQGPARASQRLVDEVIDNLGSHKMSCHRIFPARRSNSRRIDPPGAKSLPRLQEDLGVDGIQSNPFLSSRLYLGSGIRIFAPFQALHRLRAWTIALLGTGMPKPSSLRSREAIALAR